MAKRLTDSDKWKDPWFLSLSNDNKAVWQYILDNCSHAGIMKKGLDLMNFCCKTSITENEFLDTFKDRVYDCETFYFIPKFLKFQYGNNLDSNRPVIVSVRTELSLLNDSSNAFRMILKSLPNDYSIIKSKSKRTDKSKSKDKSKSTATDKLIFPND